MSHRQSDIPILPEKPLITVEGRDTPYVDTWTGGEVGTK